MATSTTPTGVPVHRPVRAHPRPLPAVELTVAAPPTVAEAAASLAGWLQYLVPLVGGGGSVAFLFAVPGPRPAWLVALVAGAAVASVAAGLGLRLVERRAARRARRRQRSRYLAHLEQVAVDANRLAAAQLAAAEHVHPELPARWAAVDRTDRLWERRPGDADFLTVRVGRGPVPLAAPARLDTAGGPLAEYDPDLLAQAEDVVRRAGWLPDAPVTVPLRQLGVLALTGPAPRTRALARSLVLELAAFHAPGDLQLLAAHPATAGPAWEWLRLLPHARDPTAAPGARPHLLAIVDTTTAEPGWAARGTGGSGGPPGWSPGGSGGSGDRRGGPPVDRGSRSCSDRPRRPAPRRPASPSCGWPRPPPLSRPSCRCGSVSTTRGSRPSWRPSREAAG